MGADAARLRRGGGPRYQLQASRDGARADGTPDYPVYRGRTPSAVSPPASSTRGELTSSIREPQVRAEQEREYMQKQGTYLNGLQSHMLGDSEPDSLATRIFKKCAFVADTFSRNRHAAL